MPLGARQQWKSDSGLFKDQFVLFSTALYKIRKVIYIHKIFTNLFAINEKAVYIDHPIYTGAKRNSTKKSAETDY
jgi:hypothetical protein